MNSVGSIEDRVTAGVDWLNENGPVEWWNRIDYDRLDIDDGDVCVLGQVFAADAATTGSYNGWEYAIISMDLNNGTVQHGFTPHFLYPDDADGLREEWINRIEGIRAEVSA